MKALGALVLVALASPAPPPPDFSSQVLPQLTKAGCNQGTCHGAAIGRGGLRLSLLGGDPRADYDALVRELGGRRVRLDRPEASLLMQKATGGLGHGGGARWTRASPGYRAVVTWLGAGAPYGKGRALQGLRVAPREALATVGSTIPLQVVALYADGSQESVTPLALYDTRDEAVATVDAAGRVRVVASGVTAVQIRYRGAVAAVWVGAPYPGPKPKPPVAQNPIDRALFAELTRLQLTPAPRCDDATFLRRVSLDLIGTLPTPAEVRAFQKSPQREALVDRLLRRPEFTALWTLKLADLLRISPKRFGSEAAARYHGWLGEQVGRNVPLNRLVSELLTQQEAFWRTQGDPRDLSELFARTWLGTRVECARCHNHPYDRWTREDYHRFAAAFGRPGQVPHPKTGKPVSAQALGEALPLGSRAELAAWVVRSPLLASSLTNRLWGELFGRGLVEPVDDLRPSNPAVFPTVLVAATGELKRTGYDLRATLRSWVLSRTYQQASQGKASEALFARAPLKPLRAQVLVDALVQATGGTLGLPGRAIALEDPEVPSATLDVLGRCRREGDCTPATEAGGLAVALHLLGGAPLQGLVQQGAAALCAAYPTDAALLEELYLRSLSRVPTAEERRYGEALLKRGRVRATEDLLWALVNTREFSYNH